MITTIDPKMFNLILTFNILLIVVLGGNGSITGSMLGAIIVTVLMEALRFLDMPMNLLFIKTKGLPGLRMVIFSIILMIVVLYRQKGLMGNKEFSWDMVGQVPAGVIKESGAKAPERRPLMLRTDSVSMRFGGLTAVADLNVR
jgi:branched-chain amino acid transport system permease protein